MFNAEKVSGRIMDILETLRNEAVTARNSLSAKYGKNLPLTDPRIQAARHIKAAISTAYIAAWHWHENMTRPEWWLLAFGQVPPTVQDELDDFGSFLVSG